MLVIRVIESVYHFMYQLLFNDLLMLIIAILFFMTQMKDSSFNEWQKI